MNAVKKISVLVVIVSSAVWYYVKQLRPSILERTNIEFKNACNTGWYPVVKRILESTNNKHLELEIGVILAANKGYKEIVELLVDTGGVTNYNAGLYASVSGLSQDCADYFLEKGATNLKDCLIVACQKNRLNLVESLIKAGANPTHGLVHSKSLHITNVLLAAKKVV